MLNFIENILMLLFSVLPNAGAGSSVINAVNNAFITVSPVFAKLNLIFPVFVLFKILLIVLFVELTLFLFSLVLKMATFFKP